MAFEHKLPSNLNPTGNIIVPLCIPHDPHWISLILGAIGTLEQEDYYQRDPNYDNEDAKTVVSRWRETTITPLIDAIANAEGCEMTLPVGSSIQFFGSAAPDGWLFCDGAAISRSAYADLFAVIGTTYGAGDGSTTFHLPDMRGRVPVGTGTGSGLTNRALGSTFGTETHQLTIGEMPTHNHEIQRSNTTGTNVDRVAGGAGSATDIGISAAAIHVKGGNQAHNNMQPSLAVNYIIKV